MKKTFITTFLLLLLLNVVSYFMLPERVAVHFGKGGRANGWAGKEINVLAFSAIAILFFLMFLYTPAIMRKTPVKWINLPNKDFRLNEENKPAALEKLGNLMYEFGTALFLFLMAVTFLTIDANQSTPVRLKENIFFPVLIVFLIYTVYWCIKIFLAFKIPGDRLSR